MIIDAHQHFWKRSNRQFNYRWQEAPALEPIRRDFMPADLKPLMDAAGVDRTIFVQTQHDVQENRWVLDLADAHDWIAGVVGWVDLGSTECEAQLLEFLPHRKFVGIRHVTHDEPDEDFIVRPQVLAGLGVLEKHRVPFDLLFFVKHLHHAATLARKFPELPLVIDHLAKPCIREGRVEDWLPQFKAAAQYPNVYCKLSGMITEADWKQWKAADLRPYVQHALELFGAERLMFGSDWPVSQLAGGYGQVLQALREALGPISASEQARIFSDTAIQFYRLDV